MLARPYLVCMILAFSMAGCLGGGSSAAMDLEADDGDVMSFRPISEQGTLDLVPPTPPPRNTSPACRLVVAGQPHRVLDLAGTIDWEATSDRTRELHFTLETGNPDADRSIKGPSPLNLTAPSFDILADGKFGILVSLIGDDPLDQFLDPQTFNFKAKFVAQFDADQGDLELGRWSSVCV